ncbi:MAG TPA: glycosyltransferase [Gemmatimonadaceae bacterium]|jgi:sugar transferase (PEP-CTERM/EpsH1 system associated)|nr:glycosyltransferase [Gemmatimonadaceae bacterium]
MHILWLKNELLHPLDKGGRIRTYEMLRRLRDHHRVTYIALDDHTSTEEQRASALEYCDELVLVPWRDAPLAGARRGAAILANVFSPLPFAVSPYRAKAMTDAIRARCGTQAGADRADVVVCDFLIPALNVPEGLPCPVVLFQHNVEAMIWERRTKVASNPVLKAYMGEQWRRMKRLEREQCLRFDHVVAVSPEDAAVFREQYGVRNVSSVPTGVDTDFFRPSGIVAQRSANIVFTGSMDWMPNEDGMAWFVDEILPTIRREVPDATLTIVGRRPSAKVRALAEGRPYVTITGTVPDVRPFLEEAAVVVVPLRIGGGTRIKIYEAMGMERAVVSTTIGAEGLDVRDGEHILLADDPSSFAASLVSLLRDPARAAAIGQSAASQVRTHFGWASVAEQFAERCSAAAASASRRPIPAMSMSS